MSVADFLRQPFAATLAAVFLICASQSLAAAQSRIALVIGNSEYRSAGIADLPNAARDAAAVAKRLRSLGFSVVQGQDVSAAGMRGLISQAKRQRPSGAILFYYAGHAIAAGGDTFLLSADSSDPRSVEQVTEDAVKLSDAVHTLADPHRLTVVFLDACLTQAGAEPPALPSIDNNVFLGFASRLGEDAFDGAGENGPFARVMLAAMGLAGSDLEAAFARIAEETRRLTLNRQSPWRMSTLRKPFFFREPAAAVPPGG